MCLSRARALLVIVICFLSVRSDAASAAAVEMEDQKHTGLLLLQNLDQRIANTSWKIVVANSALCPIRMQSIGITVHNATQYAPSYRSAAINLFGFGDGLPAVLAVAEGGPGAAGGLQAGDRIAKIDGEAITPSLPHPAAKEDYASIQAFMTRLEGLRADYPVKLTVTRETGMATLLVTPASVCKSRVEVVPSGTINAGSNGLTVQINSKLALWVRSDDELAIIIAHEMAHNVLDHNAKIAAEGIGSGIFAAFGGGGGKLRDMEREADRYGLYFAARAGFDYRAAPDLWRRLANTTGLSAIWATSHPTAANRARFNQDVVAEIDRQIAAGGLLSPF